MFLSPSLFVRSSLSTYSEPSVEYTYPIVLKMNNPECKLLLMNFFISVPNPMVIGYDNIVKYRLEVVNCVCNLSFFVIMTFEAKKISLGINTSALGILDPRRALNLQGAVKITIPNIETLVNATPRVLLQFIASDGSINTVKSFELSGVRIVKPIEIIRAGILVNAQFINGDKEVKLVKGMGTPILIKLKNNLLYRVRNIVIDVLVNGSSIISKNLGAVLKPGEELSIEEILSTSDLDTGKYIITIRVYYLVEVLGVQTFTDSQPLLLEVIEVPELIISTDRYEYLANDLITINGVIIGDLKRISDIELEVKYDREWIPIYSIKPVNNTFSISFTLEAIPVFSIQYVSIRARALIDNKTIVSNELMIKLYSLSYVASVLMVDIDVSPQVIFEDESCRVVVRTDPSYQFCLPFFIEMCSVSNIFMCNSVARVQVCRGEGEVILSNLRADRYLVRAVLKMGQYEVRSLSKFLDVISKPKLVVNLPPYVFPNSIVEISLDLLGKERAIYRSFDVDIFLKTRDGLVISNVSTALSVDEVPKVVSIRAPQVLGTYLIEVISRSLNASICKELNVVKPRIQLFLSPSSEVEVNTNVSVKVVVDPAINASGDLVIIDSQSKQNVSVISDVEIVNGVAVISFRAPSKAGLYEVLFSIDNVASESTMLKTYESVRKVEVEIYKKSVAPGDDVLVRISIVPPINKDLMALVQVLRDSEVVDERSTLVPSSGTTIFSFKAPSEKGMYVVRVFIPNLDIEGRDVFNVERSRGFIFEEFMQFGGLIIGAISISVLLFVLGRRGRART